jgi:O-antigen ligase
MATITTLEQLPQPRPVVVPASLEPGEVVQPASPLGYAIFLLCNFVLFVRPTEFVPSLRGLEIYQLLMIVCLAFSIPDVLRWFDTRRLAANPIVVCVLGLLLAMVLSHLVHLALDPAARAGFLFVKVVVYFFLFVSLVNTPERLKQFLLWVTISCLIVATLNVLHYHGMLEMPDLRITKEQDWDPEQGAKVAVLRLQGTGSFADPNETCVLLVLAIVLTLFWLTEPRSGAFAILWLVPLGLLFYALVLTQSRGGLLTLLVSLAVFFRARFGWATTLVLGAVGLPVLLLLVGGRQASLSTASGTGQERIQIWSDTLVEMRSSPLFGLGYGELARQGGLVAHNSYLQAFAELGVLGGVLFFGAFFLGGRGLIQLTLQQRTVHDPELRRMLPYVTAAFAGYLVGMMSLTMNERVAPTYPVLAMVTVYLAMVKATPPLPKTHFDMGLLGRLAMASAGFLAFMYLCVRLLVQRG